MLTHDPTGTWKAVLLLRVPNPSSGISCHRTEKQRAAEAIVYPLCFPQKSALSVRSFSLSIYSSLPPTRIFYTLPSYTPSRFSVVFMGLYSLIIQRPSGRVYFKFTSAFGSIIG